MRVAYFISSFRSPQQLRRLVLTLRSAEPDCVILIHHDRFGCDLPSDLFSDVAGVEVQFSEEPIKWGDFSLDEARFRCFRWLLDNETFDWLVLLSEQDYPVQPLAKLEQRLGQTGANAILDACPLDGVDQAGQRAELETRYLYRYSSLPRVSGGWLPQRVRDGLRLLRRYGFLAFNRVQRRMALYPWPEAVDRPSMFGRRARVSLPADGFEIWFSSAWFALDRLAVERLLGQIEDDPRIVDHYRRTIIPVESIVASVLVNDPAIQVETAALHFVRWTNASTGRPDTLGLEDFDDVMESGCFFARKFDAEVDSAILDRLDEVVLRAEAQLTSTDADR